MDELMHIPQGRHWAVPLLGAATLTVLAFQITPGGWAMLLLAAAGVLGVWALINWIHHMTLVIGEERRRNREIDYRFSPNFLAETVAKMTPDQLKAIRAGRQIIEILPGDRGPVEKLGGTLAYMYLVWYVLINSDDYHVYPVNRFFPGTYHYDVLGDGAVDDHQQAKNFHQWLYTNGFAMWGKGNTSMSWLPGWNPERVMKVLGLERDTYDE